MPDVRFQGGPLDGDTGVVGVDLDVIEFRPDAIVPLLERTPSTENVFGEESVIYRRSMKTRDIYVFQP